MQHLTCRFLRKRCLCDVSDRKPQKGFFEVTRAFQMVLYNFITRKVSLSKRGDSPLRETVPDLTIFFLPSSAMTHVMMVMVMMVRAAMPHHRTVVMMSHPPAPAAKSAIGMDMRPMMIPIMRAREQTTDKNQYNKNDKTEHCYSPFAADPALVSS